MLHPAKTNIIPITENTAINTNIHTATEKNKLRTKITQGCANNEKKKSCSAYN